MDKTSKTTDNKDKTNATWSYDNEAILIHTLRKANEDSKWGDNNPKETAWTLCVTALSGSENASGEALKDAKVIRWKWQHIRVPHISSIVCAISFHSSAETGIQWAWKAL
jgi:hypothetical protein